MVKEKKYLKAIYKTLVLIHNLDGAHEPSQDDIEITNRIISAWGFVRNKSFKLYHHWRYQLLLKAKEITKIAVERGLIKTSGKRPSAIIAAIIYWDIKKNRNNSLFTKIEQGKFGLREWNIETFENEIKKQEKKSLIPEKKRSVVGDPINFEGLIYGPLN